MGSFSRQTLETTHKSNVALIGSWRPNGASATAAANIRANWITSVTHSATGTYLVTLDTEYRSMNGPVHLSANLRMGSGALSWARGGAYDSSAGTIVVYTFTEAADTTALADIASDADSWVDMTVVFQRSNVVDGSNVNT